MKLPTRVIFKAVQPYVVAAAIVVVTSLLVFVIYFTQQNLPWVAFLTGILVAGVMGLVSRASRAEWIIARRDAKIKQLQERLANEVRLRHGFEKKLAEATDKSLKPPMPEAKPGLSLPKVGSAQDIYVQSLSEEMAGTEDPVKRILSSIEHDDFRLYCQRIVPLAAGSGQADFYEILIRLIEEEEGLMPPGAFFPLVEKYGLMPRLDRWVVQHVIQWIASHPPSATAEYRSIFFINLAISTLRDRSFPGFVHDRLEQSGVPPHLLCFEITEAGLAQAHDDISVFSAEVRRNGCKVALSNFGREHALFELLREVRVDFLKIDGSLILDILRAPAAAAQVSAIARVAKTIEVKTIAEMVETDACQAKLRQIGIDHAQGFGISLPFPLDDLH